MTKALDLKRELHQAQKQRALISNYQEILVISEYLRQALQAAKVECSQHFLLLLKKLEKEKDPHKFKSNQKVTSALLSTM